MVLKPNPPCQLSLWEETGVPRKNPQLSVERCHCQFVFTIVNFMHSESFTVRESSFCTNWSPITLHIRKETRLFRFTKIYLL